MGKAPDNAVMCMSELDKLDNIFNSLKSATEAAENVESQLHNALLSFNGILLSAFSIIVALNPEKYAIFLLPYFIFSFIPIMLLIGKLYQVRQNFFDRIADKTKEYFIEFFEHPEQPEKNKSKKTKWHNNWNQKCQKVLFVSDKVAVAFTLANPIVLLIIIWNVTIAS